MKKKISSILQSSMQSPACRWYGIASLAVIIGWLPWIFYSSSICIGDDWSSCYNFYEAVRKSIVEYGQFPFWHPWHLGGSPLFARPQIGVFAIETVCSCLFGTIRGINLATFIYAFIGMTGMWYLSGDIVKRYPVRCWMAILFGLQGTLPIHLLGGHVIMSTAMWMPWLFFAGFRLHRSYKWGLFMGLIGGLMYLENIHYLSAINSTVAGVIVAVELIKHRKELSFYYNIAAGGLLFIFLAAYRTIVTWELFSEFPRNATDGASISLWTFIKALVYPGQYYDNMGWVIQDLWHWHEIGCYLGIIALLMFLLSFRKQLKWYHWGFIISLPLALDSKHIYLPGYWVSQLPIYKSLLVITRWRFVTTLCIITGAGVGMEYIWSKLPEKRKFIIPVLILISVSGLIYNLYFLWFKMDRTTEQQALSTVPYQSKTIINSNNWKLNRYAACAKGVGMVSTYDPLLDWSKGALRTVRLTVENPKYPGEIFTLPPKPLEVDWSPNRISLNPPTGCKLFINQNPSRYWRVNGKKLFPNGHEFDMQSIILVTIATPGEKIFTLRPALHEAALGITFVAGLALLILLATPAAYAKWLKRNETQTSNAELDKNTEQD